MGQNNPVRHENFIRPFLCDFIILEIGANLFVMSVMRAGGLFNCYSSHSGPGIMVIDRFKIRIWVPIKRMAKCT